MWIRYAVAIAEDVIQEDARTMAEMSEIVTSKISLHFWDQASLESWRPHNWINASRRWVMPNVLHWSALSFPCEAFSRFDRMEGTHVGVEMSNKSDQIWFSSSTIRTCPSHINMLAPMYIMELDLIKVLFGQGLKMENTKRKK